jgi:hypothetical protein
LAQEKLPLIALANGSEHFAQNGALIRGAFSSQLGQRYWPGSTSAAQATQSGG